MGGASTWEILDESDEDKDSKPSSKIVTPSSTAERQQVREVREKSKTSSSKKMAKAESESEEEDVIVLTKEEVSGASSKGVSAVTSSLSELIMLEPSTKESGKLEQSQSTGGAVGSSTVGEGRGKEKKELKKEQGDTNRPQGRTNVSRGRGKKRRGSKS